MVVWKEAGSRYWRADTKDWVGGRRRTAAIAYLKELSRYGDDDDDEVSKHVVGKDGEKLD